MMKKKVSLILVAVLAVVICMALLVNYKTDNLGQPAICVSIDENGNCTGTATTFAADVKQVVFVCQRKKPFIGNATISWYSDNDNNTPIKTETVSANKAGYYVSTFSQEDGLTTGDYHAYIDISYALGSSKSVANFTVE
ncbi:hypothetical protein HMPREF0866_00323 [Ruminococcaceae bacterium D16]|nr:hypothetical protein HMPREF0866_00323 [Ruminococcaceae bacterium D16]